MHQALSLSQTTLPLFQQRYRKIKLSYLLNIFKGAHTLRMQDVCPTGQDVTWMSEEKKKEVILLMSYEYLRNMLH